MSVAQGEIHLAQTRPLVQGYRGVVLVIGDDPAFRRAVKAALEQSGFRVYCARNAATAAVEPGKPNPAVILADVEKADAESLAMVRRLAADRRWIGVPIVVTSRQPGKEMKWRSWEAGADAFLGRPFRPSELVQVVRGVLEGRI